MTNFFRKAILNIIDRTISVLDRMILTQVRNDPKATDYDLFTAYCDTL